MSRIGKQPVVLPAGTTITLKDGQYEVTGPKGVLQVPSFDGVNLKNEGETAVLECTKPEAKAHYGLLRALLVNAVTGVNDGWKKNLELHGVGMRATLAGADLNLSLGFSHPVQVKAPEGITFTVTKNVISVSGIDKQLVGEIAARIRKYRTPEPYKGKGIRYSGEYVRRKAGKAAKAATATAK